MGSSRYGPDKAFEHPNNTGRFRQAIRILTGDEWPEGKPYPFAVKPKAQVFSVADMKAILSAHNPPSRAGAHVAKSWSICSPFAEPLPKEIDDSATAESRLSEHVKLGINVVKGI